MENKTRSPTLNARINTIFQLNKVNQDGYDQFHLGEQIVFRVRLFGVIVSKFDKYTDEDTLLSSFITLDDGSATISARFWNNNLDDVKNLINQIKAVHIGEICDITGRIREYENERYLLMENIVGQKSIDWEMKQRLLLIKRERNHEINVIDTDTLALLESFEDNYKLNTPVLISNRSGIDLERVNHHLQILYNEGLILCPSEGYYKKVS